MVEYNEELAKKEIERIAREHNLRPEILQEVIWGRAKGLSQKQTAIEYNINPNTVSRYTRILRKEVPEEEISGLLVAAGILFGGLYLLSKLIE